MTSNKGSSDISKTPSGFDTMTMAHIAIETIVIGGLGWYFQKKTSELQEQNKLLTEKIVALEEAITKQGEYIARHDHILNQIYPMLQSHPQQSQGITPLSKNQSNNQQRPQSASNTNQKSQQKPQQKQKLQQKQVEEYDSDEDEEVARELGGSSNNEECEGDECSVSDYKKKVKK